MHFRHAVPLLFLLLPPGTATAQDTAPFPEGRYRELQEEVRFVPPGQPAEPATPVPFDRHSLYWPTLLLLATVSVAGLAFLAYRGWHDGRVAVSDGAPDAVGPSVESRTIDEAEVVRHGAPPGLLRQAENEGHYGLAARLLFLDLLAGLQQTGALEWRRDYSNQDYCHQLRGHPLAADFRAVAAAYERCYYGRYPVDRLAYRALQLRVAGLRNRPSPPADQPSPA